MAVLDMMELHQFRHSAFCLKVRMVLQAKGLSFRTVEVTPGVGQVAVFRLSGQRQVPVLVDGDQVIADSSAIALHLDQREPDPALIPTDPRQAAQVHLLEDWADTTLAMAGRSSLVQAAALDPELRVALLPDDLPDPVRSVMLLTQPPGITPITERTGSGRSSGSRATRSSGSSAAACTREERPAIASVVSAQSSRRCTWAAWRGSTGIRAGSGSR